MSIALVLAKHFHSPWSLTSGIHFDNDETLRTRSSVQGRSSTLLTRWLAVLLFVFALPSRAQTNSPFGRTEPGWQSIYLDKSSQRENPFIVYDADGRKAATAVVYIVAHGQDKLYGDRQVELNPKLYVRVSNLTSHCKLIVGWINFNFKTNDQDTPIVLGAGLESKVLPGQILKRLFTLPTVTTYINHTSVLTQVHPELVLNCPIGKNSESVQNASKSKIANVERSDTKINLGSTGNAASDPSVIFRTPAALQALVNNLGQFSGAQEPLWQYIGGNRVPAVPATRNFSYTEIRSKGCTFSYSIAYGNHEWPEPRVFDLSLRDSWFDDANLRTGESYLYLRNANGSEASFPTVNIASQAELKSLVRQASESCNGTIKH